jgi:sensor histidine kinase regulating citrate/malate metabolism
LEYEDSDQSPIQVTLRRTRDELKLEVRNSYHGVIAMDEVGRPIGTRKEGHDGIGIPTVSLIADSAGGALALTAKNGIFSAKVTLRSREIADL